MPTIILNQELEYDFEGYTYGNTFAFYIDFFEDKAETQPIDLTGSTFLMRFKRPDNGCCFGSATHEDLELGSGITVSNDDLGNVNNRFNVSKILESLAGHYDQYITWTDSLGVVRTFERGKLKIDPK